MELKARNTIRYYHEGEFLYLFGKKNKFKIKANEDDYLYIHSMISELREGIREDAVTEKYNRYLSFLTFLIEKDVVYKINSKILRRHCNYEYFPWLEGITLSMEESLLRLSNINLVLPEEHIATPTIIKKCEDYKLQYQLSRNTKLFQVLEGEKLLSSYHTYINDYNEIVVSPHLDLDGSMVENTMISGKILAQFIFQALLTSSLSSSNSMFFIKENLEVIKKEYFELKTENKTAQRYVENNDTITSLNALENFLKKYDSTVSSFNMNKKYKDYLQLPVQVFTVQRKQKKGEEENVYIADVNYERLAKFVVEVIFVEALRKEHDKDLYLLQNSNVIHKTKVNEAVRQSELMYIEPGSLPDSSMINSLLNKQKLRLSFILNLAENNELELYIKDRVRDDYFKFNYTIMNKEYIPLVIYTWISAYTNNIDFRDACFHKVKIKADRLNSINYESISKGEQKKNNKLKNLNITKILGEMGYGYEIMEG